jgi:hypothetical protein
MSDQPTPAGDAWLDAMHDAAARRYGRLAADTVRAVFTADGFDWHSHATQVAVARAFRDLPDDTDLADGIAQVICAVYTDHGFAHDPATVRQAVARQLGDAGPHGDRPGARTSW